MSEKCQQIWNENVAKFVAKFRKMPKKSAKNVGKMYKVS